MEFYLFSDLIFPHYALQVFARIAPSNQLNNFKDSIKLFLQHFLLKGASKSGLPDEDVDVLQARIALASGSIENLDSRVRF